MRKSLRGNLGEKLQRKNFFVPNGHKAQIEVCFQSEISLLKITHARSSPASRGARTEAGGGRIRTAILQLRNPLVVQLDSPPAGG
jgi:hypothetical protein